MTRWAEIKKINIFQSSRDKKNEPNFLKSFSVFLNTNLNIKPKKSNKKNNLL